MNVTPHQDEHPAAVRATHWATAGLVAVVYGLAWSRESFPHQAAWMLMLHRSVGVGILMLTLIRLAIRAHSHLPPWPQDLPRWQREAAKWSEIGLYAGLLMQPLLGLTGSLLQGPAVLFGLTLPAPFTPDRPLGHTVLGAHGVASLGLIASIGLHVAAALQHHFIRRDDVLARMLPAARRTRWRGTDSGRR